MSAFIDITGLRFGRLTVIGREPYKPNKELHWVVKCDCGTSKIVQSGALRHGKTNSCGCLKREQDKTNLNCVVHGKTHSREYRSWLKMRERCNDKKHKYYHNYGGRGIKVCERWINSFENFLSDMGERPADRSLDRIDVNGNYEPSNCRWATRIEQANNTRKKAA